MEPRTRSKILRNGVIIAAAIVFFVVAFNGVIGYREIDTVVQNFEDARQSGNTLTDLDGVLNGLLNAETGERGFLLTGEQYYLEPYRDAASQVEMHLRRVDQLTLTEPNQQAQFRILRSLVSRKLAEMQQTLAAYNANDASGALALVRGGDGEQFMNGVRRTAEVMKAEEERQRAVARVKADASGRRAMSVVVTSTTVAGILLLLTYVQFGLSARSEQLAREKAESAWRAEIRAREDSETANRVKDQFMASVSHELRTPLTSILGWSAMLTADGVEPDLIKEGLTTIQRSASVQKKLIEDLLDVSRVLTGKLRLSLRTLELSDAVRGALDSMRPAADAKSMTILANLERGIRISGDPDRLQQIVWNLITNAVKFTPRDGTIEVNVRREGSRSIIEVRDSGEGIDESFLPHVFEPFRQSDSSRARVHKGLGLGLSIVKYLTEAHGGTVSVWSAGKGRGTTFRVSLPIMPIVYTGMPDDSTTPLSAELDEMAAIELPSTDALSGLSVLIVDDHAPTLGILGLVLRKSGAVVYAAGSAAEAFELLRAHRPDIVVSDIGMPDEDGLSFIGRIRALPEKDGGQTPAIALTAYIRREDCDRLLAGGFQAYLVKPIEPIELVNAISALSHQNA